MYLKPGRKLKTPKHTYTVEGQLCQGGQSLLYLGVDEGTKKRVVIKTVSTEDPAKSRIQVQQLKAEWKALSLCNSPFIVKLHNAFEINRKGQTIPFLVMDYVEGVGLRDYVLNGYANTFDKKLKIVFGLMSAVHYLHVNNIVHRDINPNNVLVDKTGKAVLIDFGTSEVDRIGQRGLMVETFKYAPPETRAGLITFESDIYSLGSTLFFIFSGQDPVSTNGKNMGPYDLRAVAPGVPPYIADTIYYATWPEIESRYESVSEMANSLQIKLPFYLRIDNRLVCVRKKSITVGRREPINPLGEFVDVYIDDPEKYVSILQCRIEERKTPEGPVYFILDGDGEGNPSRNGTYIYRPSGSSFPPPSSTGCYDTWSPVDPHRGELIANGDRVALAYSPTKGPYREMIFRY